VQHRRILISGLSIAVALLLPAATPALAGPAFDFLFSVSSVGSDQQYFLNLAVDNYGYTRAELDPVLPRLRSLDGDLPVAMFLAHESGEPLSVIVGLRAQGLSWSVVFGRLRVAPAVLFAGIDRDPGPPYGKAWGHWRKNPKAVRLSDNDVVGLVQIQVGSRWARMSPYEVARARGQGKTVSVLIGEKKGRPWKAHKAQHAGKPGQGSGKGQGKSGKEQPKPKGQGHHGNPTAD
jgi:hypothetical protein